MRALVEASQGKAAAKHCCRLNKGGMIRCRKMQEDAEDVTEVTELARQRFCSVKTNHEQVG